VATFQLPRRLLGRAAPAAAAAGAAVKVSVPEYAFAMQLKIAAATTPVLCGCVDEYRFAPPRRWRLDFAWPAHRVAVEIEGGAWTQGRHVRGKGFEADCRKYASALVAGWRVLRVTPAMVREGTALRMVMALLTRAAARAE
jgi:very-short-patch-repair endonuclease